MSGIDVYKRQHHRSAALRVHRDFAHPFKLLDEDNRKELLAGISHDLSTPLTAIKGYVSGLIDVYKRQSLGRVSVPMWPFNLSVRLPIVDLVGRYPANYLIGRESILQRIAPLISPPCDGNMSCGISVRFQTLSPSEGQVTHALLTRPPLTWRSKLLLVRSTCMC